MKQVLLRVSIFLLAFQIGIALIWFSDGILDLIFPTPEITRIKSPISAKEGVRVKIKDIEFNGARFVYDVEITNRSSETLHYIGYSKESVCSPKIENNYKVEQIFCMCGTGLESQELQSNEIVNHTIILPFGYDNIRGQTRLGFNFTIEEDKQQTTFWSDQFNLDSIAKNTF